MKKIIILVSLTFFFAACGENNTPQGMLDSAVKLEQSYEWDKAEAKYKEILEKFPSGPQNELAKQGAERAAGKIKDLNEAIVQTKNNTQKANYQEALDIITKLETSGISKSVKQELDALRKNVEEEKKTNLLGGGYQDAKWGMSKEEVKNALNRKVLEQGDLYLAFKIDREGFITCYFYKDKFFKAVYHPGGLLSEDNNHDDNSISAVLGSLSLKYGKPKTENNMSRAMFGHDDFQRPVEYYYWEDENTLIEMSFYKNKGYSDSLIYKSIEINYISKKIQSDKEREDTLKEVETLKKNADTYTQNI